MLRVWALRVLQLQLTLPLAVEELHAVELVVGALRGESRQNPWQRPSPQRQQAGACITASQ